MDLLLLSRKLNNSEKSLCSSLKNESLENPTLIPKERDPIINLQVVNHKTKVLTWLRTSFRIMKDGTIGILILRISIFYRTFERT